MPGYVSALVVQQADGVATPGVSNVSLLNPQAVYTLPAGYIDRVGKKFLISASGRITTVAAPGTLQFRVNFAGIAVTTSTAITLKASQTNLAWFMEIYLTVRSIGSSTSATIFGQGSIDTEAVTASVAGQSTGVAWQASAPVVGAGFSTVVANPVDLTATTTTATTNSYQCHTFSLYDLTTTP